jgi:hypothetical protein
MPFQHLFYPNHDANFELFCSRIREEYIVGLFTLPPLKRALEALEMPQRERDLSTHVQLFHLIGRHIGVSRR